MSNIVAFIGIGCLSSYVLMKLSKDMPIFSMALIMLFLITSPMYLAFASLAMLETLGSLIQSLGSDSSKLASAFSRVLLSLA